ncbi:hypothetical protein NQ317_011403 [Molorchus minor]|uniref:Methyltransferase domain-containing protein n=1 Tax=Molorchus minor TaxID=1323400 RepID=A0ABQ9IXN9_9CUCU|nr:hypothetical protein NQ317_011403 [Molorchus minor]
MLIEQDNDIEVAQYLLHNSPTSNGTNLVQPEPKSPDVNLALRVHELQISIEMALPPSYNTSQEYVTDCLEFLKFNQWLFNYNNTHILTKHILDNFPAEWLSYFHSLSTDDLNRLPLGYTNGYLSHLLNICYQYTVVGIDCSSEKIALAYKNQDKYFSICKDNVKFVELSIDENSAEKIKLLKQEYFQEMNDKSRCCIVGLHACADLSITVLELFDKLNFVNCLVIMPCCYHMIDLEKSVNEREYFKRFPTSKLFKQMWKQLDAESYIKRTF